MNFNIFLKKRGVYRCPLNLWPAYSGKKIYLSLNFSFSTESSRKKCLHYKKDYFSLLAASKKNMPNILETLIKYPDPSYLCLILKSFLELKFSPTEHKHLEDVVSNFLKTEIKNPDLLLTIYRSLPKGHTSLIQETFDHIQKNILNILPVFNPNKINELIELTKLFPFSNNKTNEFIDNLTKYLSLSEMERTQNYLKKLKIDDLVENEKKYLELSKIDGDLEIFKLTLKQTNQEIILCGSNPYPCENLDKILSIMNSEKNKINLLIVQDIPILDKKYGGEEDESFENRSSKTLAQFFKEKQFKDELEGDLLGFYAKSFINNEFFVMNMKEKKIYQKYNDFYYVPSELGTLVVNFILNCNSAQNCKVILADYPTIFQISDQTKSKNIEECRDLLNICNYVGLLEKTMFSQNTYQLGCYKCNENDESELNLPRDYISILQGGIHFPTKEKINYVSNKIFKSILQHSHYEKILVLVSSPIVVDVLKNLLYFSQQMRLGSKENFSEMGYLKESLNIFRDVDKHAEVLEKMVILENLFSTFCIDLMNLQKQDPKVNITFQRYVDFHQFYSEIFSYQTLADETFEFVDNNETDKDDESKIHICPSNALIFGSGEKKTLNKKFYLNQQYKKYFAGSSDELNDLKKTFEVINEKTALKHEVIVEDDSEKIKIKKERKEKEKDKRKKKKKE